MGRVLFLCLLASCATTWAGLSVDEIVNKALEKDELLRKERQGYEYDLTVVTQKMDREDKVFETQRSKAVVRPKKEIQCEIEDPENNEKRIKESRKIMAVMNLKKLAPRFNLSLEKEESIHNVPCYVVRFDPKPDQPYDSREEKIVNKLAGRFWISKEDFSILKSEGRLTEPTSVAWVFATMREVHFVYEAAPLPNNELAPFSFKLLYDIQTMVTFRRRKQSSTMLNYRLAGDPKQSVLTSTASPDKPYGE